MLRSPRPLSWLATSVFVLGAASSARAADPCLTAYECSQGSSTRSPNKLKVESTDRLQTAVDTGWVPKCSPPTSDGHCDQPLQFRAQVALDPQGQTPLYTIDMSKGTFLQVSWPTPDAFVVTLQPSTRKDATLNITHTITPEMGLYFNVLSFKFEISLDSTFLLNKLPNASFDYVARGNGSFEPWGFGGAQVNVKGNDLNNSRIIGITLKDLEGITGKDNITRVIDGGLYLNATTNSDFQYKTTLVKVSGGNGSITTQGGQTTYPMVDLDALDLNVSVQGTLSYDGTIDFKPVITITSIAGIGVNLNLPLDFATLAVPYGGKQDVPVSFNAVTYHVPLPNLYVEAQGSFIDFGRQDTGKRVMQQVGMENTGELTAVIKDAYCDDPQFTISSRPGTLGTDENATITVNFRATRAGSHESRCTVVSNDPDSPEQSFDVLGFGVGATLPDDQPGGAGAGGGGGSGGGFNEDAFDDSADVGSCGCRTAPSGGTSAGSLAALALAGVLGLRRRRQR